MELLRREYNLYQQSGNEGNKEAAADIKEINCLNKKIQSTEEKKFIIKNIAAFKYKKHCEIVKTIIGKYQSLNVLKDKYNMYWRGKEWKYKETNNDMMNFNRNMKEIREYEEEKNIKLSEKFEMTIEFLSSQDSMSANEEHFQSTISSKIGSCIVHMSIPETFEEEVEEESVCFNCHRTQHTFSKKFD